MILCRKKQRTKAKSGHTKVTHWQDVGVKNRRDDRCQIGSARLEIGQILRTDFCGHGSYSSIDMFAKLCLLPVY